MKSDSLSRQRIPLTLAKKLYHLSSRHCDSGVLNHAFLSRHEHEADIRPGEVAAGYHDLPCYRCRQLYWQQDVHMLMLSSAMRQLRDGNGDE